MSRKRNIIRYNRTYERMGKSVEWIDNKTEIAKQKREKRRKRESLRIFK